MSPHLKQYLVKYRYNDNNNKHRLTSLYITYFGYIILQDISSMFKTGVGQIATEDNVRVFRKKNN